MIFLLRNYLIKIWNCFFFVFGHIECTSFFYCLRKINGNYKWVSMEYLEIKYFLISYIKHFKLNSLSRYRAPHTHTEHNCYNTTRALMKDTQHSGIFSRSALHVIICFFICNNNIMLTFHEEAHIRSMCWLNENWWLMSAMRYGIARTQKGLRCKHFAERML